MDAAPAPGQSLQPEVLNKIHEWLGDEGGSKKLTDWDISRDRAVLRHPDSGRARQVFLCLARRAGRLPGEPRSAHLRKLGVDWKRVPAGPAVDQYHFIGKDIVYFHTLFWPAMLEFAGAPYRTPTNVFVHGFLTALGEKMSKSRGTGISPDFYLDLGLNSEWLRYYIAAKLNEKVEDIDFNPDDFIARVNSDLIGKYVNIARAGRAFRRRRGQPAWPRAAVRGAPQRQDARRGGGRWSARTTNAGNSPKRCARSWSSPTRPISISTRPSLGSSPRIPPRRGARWS